MKNIWCGRYEDIWFKVSKVNGNAWLIVLLGKPFWIGPNRPKFLDKWGWFGKRKDDNGLS